MKILTIHSDFLEVEPKKKAIKLAEEVPKTRKRIEDCLVVFSSVEKSDEENPEIIAKRAVEEIKDIAGQIKVSRIVIYPFVHLSPTPSSPETAIKVLKEIKRALEKDFEVYRAPFGWYKAFTIKCKGHPLAELSREISARPGEGVSVALEAEEKLKSHWFIVEPTGQMHEVHLKEGKIEGYNFTGLENLRKFAAYEMAKSRTVKEEPPHVRIMRKLEFADYEPGSDPGNFRFFPKGKLVKSLLEDWVTENLLDYGAVLSLIHI